MKTKCVLCDKPAITTAAHIPVCEQHFNEYEEEGIKYLPLDERIVYKRLLEASDKELMNQSNEDKTI